MRKKHLGILIFLLGIFLVGCGDIKSQDISSFQGISIAHRGISRITPNSDHNPSEELDVNEEQDQTLVSPTVVGYESTESVISSPEAIEYSTETPIFEDLIISPTPTQPSKNTLENTPDNDQNPVCKPEYNQNFETKVIQLINAERNKEGLPLLSEHALLTQAARLHSTDMACNQFFSHISPTNGDVERRMALQNYNYSAIGENIAAGYTSPENVVQGWMDSTGHRTNIMNATFTQIGVGYVYLEGSNLEIYWTLLVGAP